MPRSFLPVARNSEKIGTVSEWYTNLTSQVTKVTREVDRYSYTVGKYNMAIFSLQMAIGQITGAFQPFTAAISSATNALQNLIKTQFTQSLQAETGDLTSINTIQSASDGRLDFKQSREVFDRSKVELAKIASVLPFATEDYIKTFRLSVDNVAEGVLQLNPQISSDELGKEIETKGVEVAKLLTLQASTNNINPTMASKAYSQFMGGFLNTQLDLFQANNVFKEKAIEEAVKLGAKRTNTSVDLSKLSKADRYLAFINTLKASISEDLLSELENSLAGQLEGIRSSLLDNTVGLLGFNRQFEESVGFDILNGQEINSLFKALSSLGRPVIRGLTQFLMSIIKIFDPLQMFSVKILDLFSDFANKINIFGSIFASNLEYNLGQGYNKVEALQKAISTAILNAFGVEISPQDINYDNLKERLGEFFEGIFDKLKKDLQNSGAREQIKQGIKVLIQDVVVPYFQLLLEVVKELFSVDPMVGTIAGAILLAPILQAVTGIIGLLANMLSLLSSFGGLLKPILWIFGLLGKSAMFLAKILGVATQFSQLGKYISSMIPILIKNPSWSILANLLRHVSVALGGILNTILITLQGFITGIYTFIVSIGAALGVVSLLVIAIGLFLYNLYTVVSNWDTIMEGLDRWLNPNKYKGRNLNGETETDILKPYTLDELKSGNTPSQIQRREFERLAKEKETNSLSVVPSQQAQGILEKEVSNSDTTNLNSVFNNTFRIDGTQDPENVAEVIIKKMQGVFAGGLAPS